MLPWRGGRGAVDGGVVGGGRQVLFAPLCGDGRAGVEGSGHVRAGCGGQHVNEEYVVGGGRGVGNVGCCGRATATDTWMVRRGARRDCHP